MDITIEGKKFDIHGLTRKQIMALKKDGMDMAEVAKVEDFLARAEKMDAVLICAIPIRTGDFSDLTPAGYNRLVNLVYTLTFLGPDAAGNLLSPPESGRQGGSGSVETAGQNIGSGSVAPG